MHVTETVSEGLKRELKVVVPAAELENRLGAKLDDLKARVRINGFRPGKVPAQHLRRLYGRAVMAEIVQDLVSETSERAVTDRAEKPAFQPNIVLPEDKAEIEAVMEGRADLAYTLRFEVLPEIQLPDFSKISVDKEVADVTDQEVDEALQRIAAANRPFAPRQEGEAAETGDRVRIDYAGRIDGEPFQGGSAEDAELELGSGQFIPGFEDQLVGARAGETRTVEVRFPEDYGAKHLAGKEARFDVTVKEVLKPGEVELNDEFAQNLGMESLDKLRQAIRDRIAQDYAGASRQKLKRRLLDALDRITTFALPPTLVDQEFESIWRQVQGDLERSGKSFADEGTTEEAARADYRRIAERRVRLGLLLAEVGRKNDIRVSDEEVQRALVERVRQFPGQEQAVWDFYRKNPAALAELRAPIFEDKVVDYVLELADVRERTVPREALFADPEDENTEAAAQA
jgi:trigger factor